MSSKNLFYFTVALLIVFPTSLPSKENFLKNKELNIAFTGDVLLGRVIAKESKDIETTPWEKIQPFLNKWDYIISNFEGAVGSLKDIKKKLNSPLCFIVLKEDLTRWEKLPFDAISFENNHSYDLGKIGRENTINFMNSQGIEVITWESSPHIIKVGDKKIALISINEIYRKTEKKRNNFELLPQKIKLGKLLSDIVVLNIHWGVELQDWPISKMIKDAKWFIDNGVDVIIGHHPHVIIPPSKYKNRPIFYSLGNFIFDQKYDETKKGLIAICAVNNDSVTFSTFKITTPVNSTLPDKIFEDCSYDDILDKTSFKISKKFFKLDNIKVFLEQSEKTFESYFKFFRNGKEIWKSKPMPILAAYKSRLRPKLNEEVLITLENHYSTIDNEIAPRPYVYKVTKNGLIALWRGSALAWPIIDVCVLESRGNDYLCVLHRGDTFIELKPTTNERRIAFYIWNGFGFDMVEEAPKLIKKEIQELWFHNNRNLNN